MNATLTLTYFLVGALLTNVLLKLWLNARQVRHVARHRGAVPTAFASQISLADHQKAADYTLAKVKVSQIDIGIDAAVLIAWTLMGGLSALNNFILEFMAPGLWQQQRRPLHAPVSRVQRGGLARRCGLGCGQQPGARC